LEYQIKNECGLFHQFLKVRVISFLKNKSHTHCFIIIYLWH